MKILRRMTRNARRLTFLIFFFAFSGSLVFGADSATIVAKANKLFKAGKADQALTLYNQALNQEPDSPDINFNIGLAHYKKGEYEKAIPSLEKASLSGNKKLEAKANYTIGNAKYKLAKPKENVDLKSCVDLLRESLDYYKRAIELDAKDKKAKINHELAEKELKALLDKLKNQPENNSQSQGPNSKPEKEEGENQQVPPSQEQAGQKQESEAKPEPQTEQEKKAEKESENEQAQQAEALKDKEKSGDEKSAAKPLDQDGQGMSREQAKMLLEGYSQEENVKGKVKFEQKDGDLGEADKDW